MVSSRPIEECVQPYEDCAFNTTNEVPLIILGQCASHDPPRYLQTCGVATTIQIASKSNPDVWGLIAAQSHGLSSNIKA